MGIMKRPLIKILWIFRLGRKTKQIKILWIFRLAPSGASCRAELSEAKYVPGVFDGSNTTCYARFDEHQHQQSTVMRKCQSIYADMVKDHVDKKIAPLASKKSKKRAGRFTFS